MNVKLANARRSVADESRIEKLADVYMEHRHTILEYGRIGVGLIALALFVFLMHWSATT